MQADQEAHSECCEKPPNPKTWSVAARFCDGQSDHDCCGCNGECEWKDGDAGVDRGVVLRDFKVERHVVEKGPDDETLDQGSDIGNNCGRCIKEGAGYEGPGRDVDGVEDKGHEAEATENERNESAPRSPVIHHSALKKSASLWTERVT